MTVDTGRNPMMCLRLRERADPIAGLIPINDEVPTFRRNDALRFSGHTDGSQSRDGHVRGSAECGNRENESTWGIAVVFS